MALYDLYVGSTRTHAAHRDDAAYAYLARNFPGTVSQRVWGVWDDVTEDVAQFTVDLPTDALAQRVGVALSALTGNDCVLVARLSHESDRPAGGFGNRDRYRSNRVTRGAGNRTLLSDPNPLKWRYTDGPYGIAFVPNRNGDYVTFLAWQNGTISPV